MSSKKGLAKGCCSVITRIFGAGSFMALGCAIGREWGVPNGV